MSFKRTGRIVSVRNPDSSNPKDAYSNFELLVSTSDAGCYILHNGEYRKIILESRGSDGRSVINKYVMLDDEEPLSERISGFIVYVMAVLVLMFSAVNIFGWLFWGWSLSNWSAFLVVLATVAVLGSIIDH